MKRSNYQPVKTASSFSFIELLVALSLFIAMCGIQLTDQSDAFSVIHFIVAALFSLPLYLLRWWVYKKRPQPPSAFTASLLALAIMMLALTETHTPSGVINLLCFTLLMIATITPPYHIATDHQGRDG